LSLATLQRKPSYLFLFTRWSFCLPSSRGRSRARQRRGAGRWRWTSASRAGRASMVVHGCTRGGAWLCTNPTAVLWPPVGGGPSRAAAATDKEAAAANCAAARAQGIVRLAAKEGRGRAGALGSANRVQQWSSCSLLEQRQELADGINGGRGEREAGSERAREGRASEPEEASGARLSLQEGAATR